MFEELNLSKKEVLNAALISSKAYSDNDDSVSLYINGDGVHFEKKQYFDVNGTEGVIYYDVSDHTLYRDWETDRKSTRLNSSHIT